MPKRKKGKIDEVANRLLFSIALCCEQTSEHNRAETENGREDERRNVEMRTTR